MSDTVSAMPAAPDTQYNVQRYRSDFPILSEEIYGNPLIFLDNAASAQKPQQVIM